VLQPSDISLKEYGRLLFDGEAKVKYERNNTQRSRLLNVYVILSQFVNYCTSKSI